AGARLAPSSGTISGAPRLTLSDHDRRETCATDSNPKDGSATPPFQAGGLTPTRPTKRCAGSGASLNVAPDRTVLTRGRSGTPSRRRAAATTLAPNRAKDRARRVQGAGRKHLTTAAPVSSATVSRHTDRISKLCKPAWHALLRAQL